MDTTLRPGVNSPVFTGSTATTRPAPARSVALAEPVKAQADAPEAGAAPRRRAGIRWDNALQGNVARAQQALDYLERVAGELEALKASLSARLSSSRAGGRDLEAQARRLADSLAARAQQGGGGVDAELAFADGQPARQAFRITGLEPNVVQAAAPLTLALSVNGAQVSATFEAGMTPEQIAAQLDRALAPVKVRAQVGDDGRLVFFTDEASWPAVRDGIVLSGRGRASTEPVASGLQLQQLELGNPDALRQSLREVVQALEQVRRSQAAASAALSAAAAEMSAPTINPQDIALSAQDFTTVAASHDYQSLLAITSALSGVSRERVLALLGLG